MCQMRYINADNSTALLIMLSFIVSTLLAIRVSEWTFWPVDRKKRPSINLLMMLIIRMIMIGVEYSGCSGSMMLSIDSIRRCVPTIMIIAAINNAPMCSIFS